MAIMATAHSPRAERRPQAAWQRRGARTGDERASASSLSPVWVTYLPGGGRCLPSPFYDGVIPGLSETPWAETRGQDREHFD